MDMESPVLLSMLVQFQLGLWPMPMTAMIPAILAFQEVQNLAMVWTTTVMALLMKSMPVVVSIIIKTLTAMDMEAQTLSVNVVPVVISIPSILETVSTMEIWRAAPIQEHHFQTPKLQGEMVRDMIGTVVAV